MGTMSALVSPQDRQGCALRALPVCRRPYPSPTAQGRPGSGWQAPDGCEQRLQAQGGTQALSRGARRAAQGQHASLCTCPSVRAPSLYGTFVLCLRLTLTTPRLSACIRLQAEVQELLEKMGRWAALPAAQRLCHIQTIADTVVKVWCPIQSQQGVIPGRCIPALSSSAKVGPGRSARHLIVRVEHPCTDAGTPARTPAGQ